MKLISPNQAMKDRGICCCIHIPTGEKPEFKTVMKWARNDDAYTKIDESGGTDDDNLYVAVCFGDDTDQQNTFTAEDLKNKLDGLPEPTDD